MFSFRDFYNSYKRNASTLAVWAGITVPQITLGEGGPAITNGPLRFGIAPNWITIAQIGIRFLLVAIICLGGVIALVSVYNWMYNEGNEQKTYENKARLGKMMVVLTVCFILLTLFRLWVPDYQALVI